ncbi:MAG: acetolactate synthase catalytic subunit [Hyphomicrobiaceae bacterium]
MSKKRAATASNATVAIRMADAFRRHGVEVVFGQSIPSAFHLVAPQAGITQAAYRTENAGGAMADGYARVSGKVGVVTAQNGPAATLLVPPLAEALKASTPIVALVQDVARTATDRNAFQELDHLKLFDGCAKWVRRIDHVSRVEDLVDMAFMAAVSGRPGPAVLLVPADLFGETAAAAERASHIGETPLDRMGPDPERVRIAAEMLASAKAPLIIAGGGVHLSRAAGALADLQERCHLPVATTVMGKGTVDETHPLSVGIVGYFMGTGGRSQGLRRLVEEADVILLVGNRTNQNGTDSWTLYPKGRRYIHIDIDPMEVGRNYEAVRLVGDAKLALEALTQALVAGDLERRKAARGAVAGAIAEARAEWQALTGAMLTGDRLPLRPERVMGEIDRLIDDRAVVVADASYSSIWVANYLTARRPGQRFITPRGLAGLGWGLPMAIGAQLAAPSSRVICVAGDGGFAHTWAEIEMVVRLKLPITILVLNNQILGYQKDAEDSIFGAHTDACYFATVDHAAIARACGCHGVRVERADETARALAAAFASGKPALIDCIVDPQARPPITSFEGKFASPF